MDSFPAQESQNCPECCQFAIADMRRAMNGVQRAYLYAPTAANLLHFGAVFAIAAHEAKLGHDRTPPQALPS